MDLNDYLRVIKQRWYIVALGVLLAVALAVLSFYRVSSDGTLTPRKAEIWQSDATVFLTENGFPAGRRQLPLVEQQVGGETVTLPRYNDPARFASLASLYARLGSSDKVRARVLAGGPLNGSYQWVATLDTASARAVQLPAVTVFGKSATPATAQATARRALRAFIGFIEQQQRAAGIPRESRIVLQVLNQPQPAVLIQGRKRTLPVAVFLAVLFASIALAFVVDNMRRTRQEAAELRRPAELPVPGAAASQSAEPAAHAPGTATATLARRRQPPGATLR